MNINVNEVPNETSGGNSLDMPANFNLEFTDQSVGRRGCNLSSIVFTVAYVKFVKSVLSFVLSFHSFKEKSGPQLRYAARYPCPRNHFDVDLTNT